MADIRTARRADQPGGARACSASAPTTSRSRRHYLKERARFLSVRPGRHAAVAPGAPGSAAASRCAKSSTDRRQGAALDGLAGARKAAASWSASSSCCATSPRPRARPPASRVRLGRLPRAAHAAHLDHRRARHRCQGLRRQAQRQAAPLPADGAPGLVRAAQRNRRRPARRRALRAAADADAVPPLPLDELERGVHRALPRRRRPPRASTCACGAEASATSASSATPTRLTQVLNNLLIERDEVHPDARQNRNRRCSARRSRLEPRGRFGLQQRRADPPRRASECSKSSSKSKELDPPGRRHWARPGNLARHHRGPRRPHLGRARRRRGHEVRVHAASSAPEATEVEETKDVELATSPRAAGQGSPCCWSAPTCTPSYILKGLLMTAGHDVLVAQRRRRGAAAWRAQHRPALSPSTPQRAGEALALVEIIKHDPETQKPPCWSSTPTASAKKRCRRAPTSTWPMPIEPATFRDACDGWSSEAGHAQGRDACSSSTTTTPIRMICREVLENAGYAVREAADGAPRWSRRAGSGPISSCSTS